jgi:hypothetical protein
VAEKHGVERNREILVASFRYRVRSRYEQVVWRLEMICGPQLSKKKRTKIRNGGLHLRGRLSLAYTRVRGSSSAGRTLFPFFSSF